jgi:hypothetical protein
MTILHYHHVMTGRRSLKGRSSWVVTERHARARGGGRAEEADREKPDLILPKPPPLFTYADAIAKLPKKIGKAG